MQDINERNTVPKRSYRPQRRLCPVCHRVLKRSHILWRKRVIFLTGPVDVTSWAYCCPDPTCAGAREIHFSAEAETRHLKHRRFGRDVIVQVGYRRFWLHQTMYELHDWLTQHLSLPVCERQVLNLIGDFLALLRAAQPDKVRAHLKALKRLVIGLDGMQPEKGNSSLYIVRELQLGLTLLAENLDNGQDTTIRDRLLEPLKALAEELGLAWHGVVSDAQESIRTAVVKSLPGVPHQCCQSHCLREAGDLTFQADRSMKKRLKATLLRGRIKRAQKQIERLPDDDPYRPVLTDYADATQVTLLEAGVAPFELGGVRVFDDLTDLAASLARCQEKGGTSSCVA